MIRTAGLLFTAAFLCSAQVAREANLDYQSGATRAKIAAGLSSETRDERQKPRELIAALKIKPGMDVADIGTGSGYMLPFLSEAVGPEGTVWAEDIFEDFLKSAKQRTAKLNNIRFLKGNETSAALPTDSQDLILVLDTYHHFNYPEEMIGHLKMALKPEGRLVIVEYHKNEKAMPNRHALKHIRATRDEFVKEIEGFGMKAIEVKDFIPDVQWMGVFVNR